MSRRVAAPGSPAADARPLWQDPAPLRVGISTCLLGQEVRWDGGHKRDRFLTDVLGPYVEWVPVCPEQEVGMGTPREPVQLVASAGGPRMVGQRSGRDWTQAMQRYAERRARQLGKLDLCGYVLKRDSPSCGMERVRVRSPKGMPRREGRGLFAAALMERLPSLPVEEEGRLHDARLRENFVERIFAYRRLRSLLGGRFSAGELVAFHTAHKLQLLAHSPKHYRALGRLVAEAKRLPEAELRARYEQGFMEALRHLATPRRNTNVLEHCLGHLRKRLDPEARSAMKGLVEDYRRGLVPLVVPLTLIRHYVERAEVDYLRGQVFLEPHPKELMLRNHV